MTIYFRPLTMDDAVPISRLLGHDREAIECTASIPFPLTKERAREWLSKRLPANNRAYAICLDPGGELAGCIGMSGDGTAAEIGYWVGRPHWGQGIATQAVRRIMELARAEGIRQVRAETFPDNKASQRVLEKNGFVLAGHVEHDLPLRGGLRRLLVHVLKLQGE